MRDPVRYKAIAQGMSRSWRVSGADAPASALARSAAEVFVYRFDWDEEPTLLGAELSVMLGAGHGFEIPFVFGHFDLGPRANVVFTDDNEPGRTQLSRRMMGYWAEFARSGRPARGGDPAGADWLPFGTAPGAQQFMIFDTDRDGGVRMERGLLRAETVLATVKKDPRLRSAEERCSLLRDIVQSSPVLTPEAYAKAGGSECEAFPLGTRR
jgi:para-nitrobenzyl esterase